MRLCRWIDLRKGGIDWSGYQQQPHKLHDVGSNPTPATNRSLICAGHIPEQIPGLKFMADKIFGERGAFF